MIKFVKNGKYRNLEVEIKRYVENVEIPGDGFPIRESLINAFANNAFATEEFLASMSDIDFQKRVLDFKAHLISKYFFLKENDFQNLSSGTDESLCVPEVIASESNIVIDSLTNIILYFDNTGSMNSTYNKLDIMRRTVFKDKLLSYYKNDAALYEEKVRLLNFTNEKAFNVANHQGISVIGKTLVIIVQNEAHPTYHNSVFNGQSTESMKTDLFLLKQRIIENRPNGWSVLSVHIHGKGYWRSITDGYKLMMQAVQNGNNGFENEEENLLNYPEVNFIYDLDEGSTPTYYLDKIIAAMREMGYRI
jgi:hypothetical protein